MDRIYFDHNSTGPLRPEARAAWLEVADQVGGNPSSLHDAGRRSRHVIDEARERVAAALDVPEDTIVFTSGGTESNNTALFGILRTPGRGGLVTTRIEHSSVMEAADVLRDRGIDVRHVGVDRRGATDPEEVRVQVAERKPQLVSIGAANNEVGSLSPMRRLSEALGSGSDRPLFHTDAVQALGRVPVQPREWNVDLASFSAHKVGGPVGVGVLFCKSGTPLQPLLYGGGQERGLRPGTEDAPGIAAASVAIELAVREQAEFHRHTSELSAYFWSELVGLLPTVEMIGPDVTSTDRLPNTLNVRLPGTDGKVLVTQLDLEGLQVSAGSACASGSLEPSHVLLAMGLRDDDARSGLRVSFGRNNTRDECKRAVEILRIVASRSRAT